VIPGAEVAIKQVLNDGLKTKVPSFGMAQAAFSAKDIRPDWGKAAHSIPNLSDKSGFKNSFLPDAESAEKTSYLREHLQAPETHLPVSNGFWSGEAGNSEWYPDKNFVPGGPITNPDRKTYQEIFSIHGKDSITFNEGYPEFSHFSQAEVSIKEFSTNRIENFAQADKKLAQQWTEDGRDGRAWTTNDIRNYRRSNGLRSCPYNAVKSG